MPLDEYKCQCNHRWEVFRSHERFACPKCGSENIEKQVSLPGYRRDHTIHSR